MAIEMKTIALEAGRMPDPSLGDRKRIAASEARRTDPQTNDASQQSQNREQAAPEKVAKAVDSLNEYMQSMNRELNFSIDEGTGRTVVKIMDRKTREVIRQIPSEEALALAQRLADASGEKPVLFQNKA